LVLSASKKGNKNAARALDIYTYNIAKKIAALSASLQGLDALVFTAGIGENSGLIRAQICQYLRHFGLALDRQKNLHNQTFIQNKTSKVKVLIIPTNEELEIALQCLNFK
jgi:acetate kinase